ncbi:hypothetical protein AB1N83_004749 [Pleurotus pulmonarius]
MRPRSTRRRQASASAKPLSSRPLGPSGVLDAEASSSLVRLLPADLKMDVIPTWTWMATYGSVGESGLGKSRLCGSHGSLIHQLAPSLALVFEVRALACRL